MKLAWLDAEIFDLYNDIWGNGWIFDFSDFSIEYIKTWALFGAILIGSIGLAMITLPALVSAWVISAGVAGTNTAFITASALSSVVISRVIIPEWYDSPEEMFIDLSTDVVTALIFWLLWGAMTRTSYNSFMASGWKWSSKAGSMHIATNTGDLIFFGISTEAIRNILIRNPELVGEAFAIEWKNRFSYEEFHSYVKLNIQSFLPHPWLS
jgi:hypothetical protein